MASKRSGSRRGTPKGEAEEDDPTHSQPLHEGLEIFEDMLRNLRSINPTLFTGGFLTINVATVCSGTDSPIFALNLIKEAAQNLGNGFISFDHKFACEIEPFKQAFIRRNTDQRLIFRNVVELGARGAEKAMVAGGYLVDIPTQKLDMFVAGCSCVDYSNLNNSRAGKTSLPIFDQYPADVLNGQQKSPIGLDPEFQERLLQSLDTIETSGAGESMKTFLASMSYIIRARPKIIILENVDTAPWAAKTNFWFPRAGYAAAHAKVNSRMYYLPQTRQRGYLVAVDAQVFGPRAADVLENCMKLLKKLEHRASSPVTEFLLGPDDPRLVEARADLEQRNTAQRDVDWGFSQVRHEATRQAAGLPATAHPFSKAVFSHGRLMRATPPSRSWIRYWNKQPPRVLDFVDITILKSLQMKCDLRYKTWVLDVSQNVDRSTVFTSTFTSKFGTIGCITPSGQPILTDQMRPITGIESLGLQGLPLDDLVLSTESQAQLQDLAGNAMTVPVVGAVILSILTTAYDFLQKTSDKSVDPGLCLVDDNNMDLENGYGLQPPVEEVASWSLGSFQTANLQNVTDLASKAARLCFCPTVDRMASNHRRSLRCLDCGATACDACQGNPRHRFEECDTPPRMSQAELRLQLGNCLPGIFELHGDIGSINLALESQNYDGDHFRDATQRMDIEVFYLQNIKVTELVTVEYKSTRVVARLVLTRNRVNWYLFPARRAGDAAVGAEYYSQPFAKAEICIWEDQRGDGHAGTVDPTEICWWVWVNRHCEGKLLLEDLSHSSEAAATAAQTVQIRFAGEADGQPQSTNPFPTDVMKAIETEVCGVYVHKPRCGTAEDSLFVKQGGPTGQFLFKDVASTGAPEHDLFVFANSCRQLESGEYREVTLRTLEESMRPVGTRLITCYVNGYWTHCEPLISVIHSPTISRPLGVGPLKLLAAAGDNRPCCKTKPPTLFDLQLEVKKLPLPTATISRWVNGLQAPLDFYAVPPSRLESFLRDIAFACPRIFGASQAQLKQLAREGGMEVVFCKDCCIAPPRNYWMTPDGTSASHPWEDPGDVETFEGRLKKLPHPISAAVKFSPNDFGRGLSDGVLDVTFTLNSRTLASRAVAHLAYGSRSGLVSSAVMKYSRVFCEVDCHYHPEATFDPLVPFHTAIHDTDSLYGLVKKQYHDRVATAVEVPECFKHAGQKLRDDQINAVRWMVGREKCASAYRETEVEEVVLPGLGARVVGRAVFENDGDLLCSRGGVIAHDIGYGKTVIVIALLEHMRDYDCRESVIQRQKAAALRKPGGIEGDSFFHLKATLIIVPGHISLQWVGEFMKFGSTASVIQISDLKTLEKVDTQKLFDADVIIASESLFGSAPYLDSIDRLGAPPESRSKPSAREARDRYGIFYESVRWAVGQCLLHTDAETLIQGLQRMVEERHLAGRGLAQQYAGPSSRRGGSSNKRAKPAGVGQHDGHSSQGSSSPEQTRVRPRKTPGGRGQGPLLWRPQAYLENFSFARIIVDEYSYQGASTLNFLSRALSSSKWLISGTPPAQNLANIADVGLALGVHVARPEPCIRPGLPPVTEGPRLHPMSASEEFRSFSTPLKSVDFTMERHGQALEFVKNFYRSNTADHSHIDVQETVIPVRLRLPTAVYYNVAHLEIADADWNLLQVPMELRSLLNVANIVATHSGEVAANLALASIANGVLGHGNWYQDMAYAVVGSTTKFGDEIKSNFDKLVFLLDRADSVAAGIQNDIKFQTVRSVAESVIRDFVNDFRRANVDTSRYGGPLPFVNIMLRIAPVSTKDVNEEGGSQQPHAYYLPVGDATKFDKRRWRRDMARTCWLNWYNLELAQFGQIDHAEAVHLASDIILHTYSEELRDQADQATDQEILAAHISNLAYRFAVGGVENWGQRELTWAWTGFYQSVSRPMLDGAGLDDLILFLLTCQESKAMAMKALSRSQRIEATSKLGKVELQRLCKSHNLRYSDAESVPTLLDKIDRYNRGLSEAADHIDGRGTSMTKEFPMLNHIKKARGSGVEATIDEISITYQRYIRSMEDYTQAMRRYELIDAITRLCLSIDTDPKCDECLVDIYEPSEVFLVVSCGHILCLGCKTKIDQDHEKAACAVEFCGAYCRNSPILRWSDLVNRKTPIEELRVCLLDETESAASNDTNGMNKVPLPKMSEKIAAIINKIQEVPDEDHILLFVPFPWLATELSTFMNAHGISHHCLVTENRLPGGVMASMAEEFKTGAKKVLMLNPTEVSCAGINLTIANHVIFAAPFLESDVYRRNQNMRQAVGRCVRPGQTKPVFVYHFMAENTIEEKALRDYAEHHPTPDNGVSRYFENSPKPWWLLKKETAAQEGDATIAGAHVQRAAVVGPEPPHRFVVDMPKPLGPATNELGNPDPRVEELEAGGNAMQSPDLWRWLSHMIGLSNRDQTVSPTDPSTWGIRALRNAVQYDKYLRRSGKWPQAGSQVP